MYDRFKPYIVRNAIRTIIKYNFIVTHCYFLAFTPCVEISTATYVCHGPRMHSACKMATSLTEKCYKRMQFFEVLRFFHMLSQATTLCRIGK